MKEDHDRTRIDDGPNIPGVLRHMALKMMPKDATKGSLGGKFEQAGRDGPYLTKLLEPF